MPETLVPDNLKTGVIKAHRVEPLLNEAYRELADYYRTVIVPSRVRKPKDKASVEGTVGYISRQIIASLRNYQCFHLDDLNQRIHEKLEEINDNRFSKTTWVTEKGIRGRGEISPSATSSKHVTNLRNGKQQKFN